MLRHVIYLVVHSGSRYLGKQVAEYYQEEAYKHLNNNSGSQIEDIIAQLKKEGRQAEIQSTIKALKSQVITNIPKSLAYLEGKLFDNYIHDMKIVQKYAIYNRKAMAESIIEALGLHIAEALSEMPYLLEAIVIQSALLPEVLPEHISQFLMI